MSALLALHALVDEVSQVESDSARKAMWGTYVQTLSDQDRAELSGSLGDVLMVTEGARDLGPGWAKRVERFLSILRKSKPEKSNVVNLPGSDHIEGLPSVTLALRAAGCPDVPDGLAIPPGYVVTADMVWARYVRGDDVSLRPIGHGLIGVVGRAVDCETGDVRAVLAWRYHDRWVRETVPRAVAMDGRKLIGLANAGCPVDGRSAPLVSTWLAMQEACISQSVAPAVSMARPGWTPDMTSYLWGSTCIAGDAIYAPPGHGEVQRAAGMREAGTLSDWKRLVWDKCKDHTAALIILSAFVPPILPILGLPGWTLDIGGATTTGKSTSARLAASVWGDPEIVTNKWPSTWPAARNLLEQSTHVPCILDDTKNVMGLPVLVKSVLYSAAFGRSQTLGQPGGGTQRERTISTVVISTGEAPAAALCGDSQGATTRIISVRKPPLPAGSTALAGALNEDCKVAHGTAGPALVRWLDANRDKWPSIVESYRTFRDTIANAARDDLEARASAYIAQLRVAAWVAEAALGIQVPAAVIDAAMECVRDGAGDRDTAMSALMWCAGWWDARPGMVEGHAAQVQKELIGWQYDDGRRAWSEQALRKALGDGGYLWQEVLSAWRDRGWLEIREPGRFSVKLSAALSASRPRAVVWSEKAMGLL